MELKVWVEGIQRVVCGVNEATTCQDVVYALAHATGQTGRFTLVEKWRHSERLLPPQEHPLKVLTKWGEYAGDVQLILRRSSDKKSQNNNDNNNKNANSQAIQQLPSKKLSADLRPFSPPNVPSGPALIPTTPVQNKEIKKSLTFSGSHGSNGSTSSNSSGHSTPQNNNTSVPGNQAHLKTDHGWDPQGKGRDPNRMARQDLPRGIVKGVPQERSSPARPRQPPSYDEAVSRSSRHHMSSQLSPFNPEKESPSSKRRLLGVGPRVSPMTAKEQRVSPNRTADSYVHHFVSHTPGGNEYKRDNVLSSPLAGSSPKDSRWSSSEKAKARKNLIGEFKKDSSPKPEKEPKTESVVVVGKSSDDPQYKDLIRLVTLQREKLNNQNAELSQFDTEIVYWESKLQEQESRLALLEEETRHLERLSEEQSQELGGLEQTEGLDSAHQDERVLRSKVSLAKAQLASCDTQLTHTRQRLRHLGDELSEERRKQTEREQAAKERDDQCQDFKKQMTKKGEEQTRQADLLKDLEKELQELDRGLADRQSQLEKLTEELREANLEALSMTIADDIKSLSEGNFHTRSGSTRRIMGSPRQLENAVPTSKNPHGVWV